MNPLSFIGNGIYHGETDYLFENKMLDIATILGFNIDGQAEELRAAFKKTDSISPESESTRPSWAGEVIYLFFFLSFDFSYCFLLLTCPVNKNEGKGR